MKSFYAVNSIFIFHTNYEKITLYDTSYVDFLSTQNAEFDRNYFGKLLFK